jgi:hypothetical protein
LTATARARAPLETKIVFVERRALSVAVLAISWGLLAGHVAEGSCGGPQLSIIGASFTPVPPDSSDPNAEPTYGVRAGQQLSVRASNLAPCSDTHATSTSGCQRQTPAQPVASPAPIRNVSLVLEQGSRRWRLGVADVAEPDDAITYAIELPQKLTRGPATLILSGPTLEGDISVLLQVS